MERLQLVLLLLFALFANGYASIDLIVTDIVFDTNQKQLQQLNASIIVKNIGNTSNTGSCITTIYLSKDQYYSSDDIYAGFISLSNLNVGATLEASVIGGANQFGINADNSYKYIIAIVDSRDEISESDETNNNLVKPIVIQNCSVDLTLDTYQTGSPSFIKHGDLLSMTVTLKNLSVNRLHNVRYTYYLSTDNVFDNNDIKMGYEYYSGFNWSNSSQTTNELAISPTISPGYYNVFINISQYGQEINFIDSDLSNNIVMLCKIYIDNSDINSVLNFDQDFFTDSWSEDGLNWRLLDGRDDIRQYLPYAGSGHVTTQVGASSKLTCSDNFIAYGVWLYVDDAMDEISSFKVVGYGSNGLEKYTKTLNVSEYSSNYAYVTLDWVDVKSIQFISTTLSEMPMSSIFYDELEYRPINVITSNVIPNNDVFELKVYPTVCKDKITVESSQKIKKVEIYNMLGVLLLESYSANDINTSNLPSGHYSVLIKFINESKTETVKIVKL